MVKIIKTEEVISKSTHSKGRLAKSNMCEIINKRKHENYMDKINWYSVGVALLDALFWIVILYILLK